ncbi:MAG: helix-turn-helix domain-containing protein [Candidatus Omnitrophica bacterium]|nr:helix-turn-helix domain-containing protein [Candidatus Omnitrophota bacterium]
MDPLRDALLDHYNFYRGTAICQIEELAHALGVKRPAVYQWMKGKRSIPEAKRALVGQWLAEKKAEIDKETELY